MEEKKTLLAAVDGSQASENAIRFAGMLAKRLGAKVLLFHVIEAEKVGYWMFIDKHFVKELEKATAKIIDRAKGLLDNIGVEYTVETRDLKQSTYLEIVAAVEQNPAALALVMGDRGLGLREHRALGSTTDRVIHEVSKRALPTPVIVVPAAGFREI
ncbi:MAG: universal stress protein [bacterium]